MFVAPGKGASSLGVIVLGVLAVAYVELCAPPRGLQPLVAASTQRPLPYALPGHQQPPAGGSHPPFISLTSLTSAVATGRSPQELEARGPPVAKQRRQAMDGSVRVDQTTSLVGNGSRSSVHDELADMSCAHDELYNNKGCQVRCERQEGQVLPAGGQWSEALLARLWEPNQPRQHARCPRAFALCAALPHCLAVKTKTGQWGTLKASRRYEPSPRPRCSGYAFGTAGPPLVRFPLAAPREDWCYRHTPNPSPSPNPNPNPNPNPLGATTPRSWP